MADAMEDESPTWQDFVTRMEQLVNMQNGTVIVTMGSTSDWRPGKTGGMWDCARVLTQLEVPFMAFVTSAHRTPERVERLARTANEGGHVVIAAAGGAAHLPGMMKAHASLVPVIGVPIIGSPPKTGFDGMDALLSIVQMPPGVPVATVGMGAAANAALLAASIVALSDQKVRKALRAYTTKQSGDVPAAPPDFDLNAK